MIIPLYFAAVSVLKQLPQNIKACINETAVLQCDVDALGITSYWLKDGKPIEFERQGNKYEITSDRKSHYLKLKNLISTDSGVYTFVAGSAKSQSALYVEGKSV